MTKKKHDIPELTDVEQARWQALKSVIGAVAEGAQSGRMTPEEAQAAQAQINSIDLDMRRVRDSLHVPDDAGDYAEALEAMLRRIPDNWGRWVSCSRGGTRWSPSSTPTSRRWTPTTCCTNAKRNTADCVTTRTPTLRRSRRRSRS